VIVLKHGPHIDRDLLNKFMAEESTEDISPWVKHLGHCSECAEAYVRVTLKSTRTKVTAPGAIWTEIAARLDRPQSFDPPRRGLRLYWRFASASILLLGTVLLLENWKMHRTTPQVDLGRYIALLEKTSAAPTAENLQETFPSSAVYDRDAALRDTGLPEQVEDYRLAAQRVMSAGSSRIIQLVYGSPGDVAIVIVAPRAAKLSFGNYHLVSADIAGLNCQRVQCPRQDIFSSNIKDRQYVFIRRRSSTVDSGRLFAQLVGSAS
jgi:hypothetical protein